jgi:dienelactone hydrolase
MSWKNLIVGFACVCACASVEADPGAAARGGAAARSTSGGPNAVSAETIATALRNEGGRPTRATAAQAEFGDGGLPSIAHTLNEQVIGIPVDPAGTITLEATVFKPDGPGPFPMVVFNHGKIEGDPRAQPRSRPLSFAREFVRRGYVVVAPNREGFANSGGQYRQQGCNVEQNGMAQAEDVAATVAFMSKMSYVDASHIVVAGASHGGLTTIAYGAAGTAPGVRGLINFSGGLRQDACANWQDNLTHAFGAYGERVHLPSLWVYGDNDSVWPADLTSRMYTGYVEHGAHASMIDVGSYKNDAHRLVVDRDGVRIWWPAVDAFLERIGMPTRIQCRVESPAEPNASGYAAVEAVDAVPYLDAAGREAYRKFLEQYPSRAFAVSSSGAWSWAEGDDDPMSVALANCQKENHDQPCRLYAVDNAVVWNDRQRATTQTAASGHGSDASGAANSTENRSFASRD